MTDFKFSFAFQRISNVVKMTNLLIKNVWELCCICFLVRATLKFLFFSFEYHFSWMCNLCICVIVIQRERCILNRQENLVIYFRWPFQYRKDSISLICNIFYLFVFRLIIFATILSTKTFFAQYLQPLAIDGLGSECALILSGGARSSAYDHTLNLFRVGSL